MMRQLVMRCGPALEGACGLCGEVVTVAAGVQVVLAEPDEPVCHSCARRHAPNLAALLRLADQAERVGRIGRHNVFPPFTALLDLARAADDYTTMRKAG